MGELALTAMSTRILGGKAQPACKTDNLTAIYEPIVQTTWDPRNLTTPQASTDCCRDSFTLFALYSVCVMCPLLFV
jgi:hypothetical protein